MSMPQPQRDWEPVQSDSLDVIDIVVDGPGDTSVRHDGLTVQQRYENRMIVDRYGIKASKLAQLKRAAIRLGRHREELVLEGLELVLEKYRDQLGDLDSPRPADDAPFSEGDTSSG